MFPRLRYSVLHSSILGVVSSCIGRVGKNFAVNGAAQEGRGVQLNTKDHCYRALCTLPPRCTRHGVDVDQLLWRLLADVKQRFDLARNVPNEAERLSWELPRFLDLAARKGRLLIVIDGLHRLQDKSGKHTDIGTYAVQRGSQAAILDKFHGPTCSHGPGTQLKPSSFPRAPAITPSQGGRPGCSGSLSTFLEMFESSSRRRTPIQTTSSFTSRKLGNTWPTPTRRCSSPNHLEPPAGARRKPPAVAVAALEALAEQEEHSKAWRRRTKGRPSTRAVIAGER